MQSRGTAQAQARVRLHTVRIELNHWPLRVTLVQMFVTAAAHEYVKLKKPISPNTVMMQLNDFCGKQTMQYP